MSVPDPCLIRSRGPCGQPVLRVGVPLVDDYLEFLEGRCRPNTVLAAAYDLRVFFTVVAKPPADFEPVDVLGFITAQRTGRSSDQPLQRVDDAKESAGVATSTVARRLSMISGFFAYLLARGDVPAIRCRGDCPPDVSARVRGRGCR
jgi:integrase/recombinase XerD